MGLMDKKNKTIFYKLPTVKLNEIFLFRDDQYYSIKGDGQISGNFFNTTSHIPVFGLDSAFAWVIGTDYDTYLILYGCKCEASTW